MVGFKEIEAAHDRIKSYIHRTPVLSSQNINEIAGCEIFFKCENLQKVGAFKFRGATNAVLQLSDEQKKNGVVTHSSGNHAQALALAAKMQGIKAVIVMPSTAPKVKKAAVAGYGAEIVECEPTLEARETTANKIISERGMTFVHPYNNDFIIAGQGTAAKELIEEVGDLDIVSAPVGGGGLLSGTAISTKAILPDAKVIAAEPKGADDAYRSFKAGKLIPQTAPNTICDGLLTSLGDKTFEVISEKVDDILTVEEETVKKAMRLTWERMKIIIEPSSAVCLATILENPEVFKGKKVGVIISGGNVDFERKFG
jgi:threonine dehydratase